MMLAQSNPPQEQWLEGKGGLKIFTRHWRPAGPPKAALAICHGVNSHGGQYIGAAEHFASRGFAVTALDLRGRGKSEGELVAEKRLPSDRLLMWLLARLDPRRFAAPWELRKDGAADPQAAARESFPALLDALADTVSE